MIDSLGEHKPSTTGNFDGVQSQIAENQSPPVTTSGFRQVADRRICGKNFSVRRTLNFIEWQDNFHGQKFLGHEKTQPGESATKRTG
jgi:hypothetical protein